MISPTKPRFARQRAEWRRERSAIYTRLIESHGYCEVCADDLIEYVVNVLKGRPVVRTPRNEGLEWQWALDPVPSGAQEDLP